MEAHQARFLDFMKKSPQVRIPIYQRTYSWAEQECLQLWRDIVRSGEDDAITAHFVGSVVYISKGLFQVILNPPLLVIDGQQRLTTVALMIAALAKALDNLPDGSQEPVDGFSPRKLRNFYLLNPEEQGERCYKLILSQTDRDSLIAVVDRKEQPKEYSRRIYENYRLFEKLIAEYKGDLATLCKGVAKLMMVDISLDRGHDNPQLIFESMNSTGRELTQADLIRNFILMDLEEPLQTRLYEDYWRPMERAFGQEAYGTHFDSFIRYYLTLKMKTGNIPRLNAVYDAFKAHATSSSKLKEAWVESLVADIGKFASYFCAMALGDEKDPKLQLAFQDLRELRVDVAYPFLLELYHDYDTGILSKEDFEKAVRLVETFVFRRTICDLPTNSHNKIFATFTKVLKKDRYLESIQAHLLLLPSYRGLPKDEEFKQKLQERDIYHFRNCSYLLKRLENYGRKERVEVTEYTIEHILPKNENLSDEWKKSLGTDWKRIREKWLHTLGNLTLTGYNSEYSDRPFDVKRNMEGGFKTSPLKLNQGLGQLPDWNEKEIKDRALRLSAEAVAVWRAPQLDDDVLAAYQSVTVSPTGFSIKDHPFLLSGKGQELFEVFRREVLALDPAINEAFLKLYVAYKTENHIVDVIPQAKQLLLTLNMAFDAVTDMRGLCIDVTNVGHWGNGDVQVGFAELEELPYIIGLVRQSFEQQMGNGNE
jgi:uncharacterized protein with ParB-like and HNH nuclease domain/predicted transport protein